MLALAMGLPLFALGGAALVSIFAGDRTLSSAILVVALSETGLLMLEVGLATAIIGLVTAWLVSHFEFPGRAVLDWALILPLAIPTYLSAYTWVEFLDFTGPVQTLVRQMGGFASLQDYWFPDIRSGTGAAIVMALVLYPYVYLSCRAYFLIQSGAMNAAARTLGAGPLRTFTTIILPLSRPAVAVGVSLALMETINDIGAVQYFGVNSLTSVVYSTWINRSNFGGAAQLSVSIVLVVGSLILLEQFARRRRSYLGAQDTRNPPPRKKLVGWGAFFATFSTTLLLALGFGVPVIELLVIAVQGLSRGAPVQNMIGAGVNSIGLALVAAFVTVAVGLFTARKINSRTNDKSTTLLKWATLGYAVPGTVLALGLLQPLGIADGWINTASRAIFDWTPGLVLSGSMMALVYAYVVRFLTISHSNLDAAIKKRGNSILDAAQVLGAKGWRRLFQIELPSLAPALFAAATLVFVEVIKELPATLLLRPLGVETLATQVFERASAELFDKAALPALMIVLAGLVPVLLANRLLDRVRRD